jgi:hypothetical protein
MQQFSDRDRPKSPDRNEKGDAPQYRGTSLEVFRHLIGRPDEEKLQALLNDCVEREAYEHARVVREVLRGQEDEDPRSTGSSRSASRREKGSVPEKKSRRSAEEAAQYIIDTYSPEEKIDVAWRILDDLYRTLQIDSPRVAEWINCTLTQLEAVMDSIRYDRSPREK